MTMPNVADPSGIQAALARRLGIVLPNGQTPFDPMQFALPGTYAAPSDADQMAAQSDQSRQYAENMTLFNKPSNTNRRRSQNIQNADTSAKVIY